MAPPFEFSEQQIGAWRLPVVLFDEHTRVLPVAVQGLIGNSITTSEVGKRHTIAWRLAVGTAVRNARGSGLWSSRDRYVITLGFSFHAASHGNKSLDIENFIKPTLDALAAGLFCTPETDLEALKRWAYYDSNFGDFFIHRLPAAASAEQEGAALLICGQSSAGR